MSGEESKQYTKIIDGILATADLATISRKKVREGLEIALGGKDLADQKVWPDPLSSTLRMVAPYHLPSPFVHLHLTLP